MLNTSLKDFIKNQCGGVRVVASKTKLSNRSIYKWISKKSLPRTEYTDETNYSKVLSELSGYSEDEIKEQFKPLPVTNEG